MFKVGQEVVCVDDSPGDPKITALLPMRPRAGVVYRVRSIHSETHIEGYGIRLEELINPSIPWVDAEECEWSFDYRRFRSLTNQDSELSMELAQ
jgi:hypothetical protein